MNRIALVLIPLATLFSAADARAQTADARSMAPRAVRLSSAGDKVTAPVEIEITPLADPAPGRRRVRVVARPSVDAASLAIEVSADEGLALAPGTSGTWTGVAQAGQEVVRELDLVVSGAGEQRVMVSATVKYGDEFTQTGIEEVALNPSRSAGLTKGFRPAATDPGGRTIVEIPAKTP
ncbi:MAG TPA: hypothetical protein VFT45_01740 [Longimicrobium sp.]|nr:hypothetical protein [Longimicrobium sp.]